MTRGQRLSIAERAYWTAYLAWNRPRQARFPFRSAAQIARAQASRVRSTVAYAYRYIPYYRETMRRMGLTPDDFRTADDLARLPIIEREQLQRDVAYFTAQHRVDHAGLRLQSSGSMGIPCVLWHDSASLIQNAVHGERQRSIWAEHIGQEFGYRETVITSGTGIARKMQEALRANTLLPPVARIQRQYLRVNDAMDKNIAEILAFRPQVLYGYGSYVGELFVNIKRQGLALPFIKLVAFASDGVSDSARRLIEEDYGIPVFGNYQAIEALQIGFECEQRQGYHLNVDLYPVRLVDDEGRASPAGEPGRVIISNLVNRATVLLNYHLRDLGILSTAPCPCGRNLPVLEAIAGRSDEFITLATGQRIHPTAIRILLRDCEGVLQFQLRQSSAFAYRAALVVRPGRDLSQIASQLSRSFRQSFGDALCLQEIEFVDEIPKPPNGKPRIILPLDPITNSEAR